MYFTLTITNFLLVLIIKIRLRNKNMSDEYLKEKVEGIIEPMVKDILNSLPDDPVHKHN